MKLKSTFFFFILATFCQAQIITIPDANFKTKLLAADTSNFFAKNMSGAFFKIDANNDGQIQQTEANEVSELYMNYTVNGNNVYISDITGITSFTNLKVLNVQNNNIVTFNISGMQLLTSIDCSNNSQYLSTLIIDNLPVLTTLNCQSAGSNVTTPVYTLQNLPNLKYINFSSCRFYSNTLDDLTSLEEIYGYAGFKSSNYTINLSNKPNLRIVDFSNDRLATINFANSNNIETLKLSANNLTVFNKNLFANLKVLDISWNKLSSLDLSNKTTLENLNCDKGSTSAAFSLSSLNVQGCTNLQKLICSRNLLLHLDLTDLSNLNYLDCSSNNSVFTNTGLMDVSLRNCSAMKNVLVSDNPYLTQLDLSCSNTFNEIRVQNCSSLQMINLKNGANESNMYAGTFSVYSCPNLNLVCVDFNENFPFLANTIAQSPYYTFTPNCKYNTVVGNVKFDLEGDGCQNNSGIAGIKVNYDYNNTPSYTFSDTNGDFYLYTQSNTITITPSNALFPLWDFGLSGSIVYNFPPNNDLYHLDLCLAPNTVHNNLEVTILPLNTARPGFDSKYKIVYKNKGNQIQSGNINLTFDDSRMDLVVANPAVSNSAINSMTWDFANFMPFETREIYFTLNLNSPVETPALNNGDVINFTSVISSVLADEIPEDNTSVLNQTVLNSFDPNNKTCLEGAVVSPSLTGKYVHYIIHFENNGTANAHNVVVRDIIDTNKFDVSSLEPLSGSSSMVTRVTNTNEVEFIFENINLPFDDANNDGYVSFKIKTKPTLVNGDTFANLANIYFDYNYPIATNNYVTTIQTLGVNQYDLKNDLSIYPNPVQNTLFFKTDEKVIRLEIYDLIGREISRMSISENKVNLSGLKTGNYILKIYTESGMINTKIIKE